MTHTVVIDGLIEQQSITNLVFVFVLFFFVFVEAVVSLFDFFEELIVNWLNLVIDGEKKKLLSAFLCLKFDSHVDKVFGALSDCRFLPEFLFFVSELLVFFENETQSIVIVLMR